MSEDDRMYTCELCGEGEMDEEAMLSHMYIAHVMDDVQQDTENQSTNQTQLPVSADVMPMHFDHQEFGSNGESDQSALPDASSVSFASYQHQSSGNACNVNKRKLSDSSIAADSSRQKNTNLPPAGAGLLNGFGVANGVPSLSQSLASTSLSSTLTPATNGMDKISLSESDAVSSAPTLADNDLQMLNLVCPMCDQQFDDAEVLQLHAQTHFEERPATSMSAAVSAVASGTSTNAVSQPKTATGSSCQRIAQPNRSIDPLLVETSQHCTAGIIEKIQRIPYKLSSYGQIKCRYLCSPTDHFISQGYNCGFRNLQMLLSCLMNDAAYIRHVFSGFPLMPSVLRLQQLIEHAWAAGFDEAGCRQLSGKLVDTRKWIGATEIYAMLSFLGVRSEIVDFHKPTGHNNRHPRLLQWVKDYLQKGQEKLLPPLYLQHQGHSQTIVGVEEMTDGSLILLIFDPGCGQMKKFPTTTSVESLMHVMRKDIGKLTSKQYQILSVTGLLSDEHEYKQRKIVTSTRIP